MMLGARLQVRPVPSGSTFRDFTTPSSTTMENLPERGTRPAATAWAWRLGKETGGLGGKPPRGPSRFYLLSRRFPKRGTNESSSNKSVSYEEKQRKGSGTPRKGQVPQLLFTLAMSFQVPASKAWHRNCPVGRGLGEHLPSQRPQWGQPGAEPKEKVKVTWKISRLVPDPPAGPAPHLVSHAVGSSPLFSHKDIVNTQTCHHLDSLGLQSPSLLHKPWQVGLGRGNKGSAKGNCLCSSAYPLSLGLLHSPVSTSLDNENCVSHSSF